MYRLMKSQHFKQKRPCWNFRFDLDKRKKKASDVSFSIRVESIRLNCLTFKSISLYVFLYLLLYDNDFKSDL